MNRFHKVFLFVLFFYFLNLIPLHVEAYECINNDSSNFTNHVNEQIDNRLKLSDTSTGLDLYSSRPTTVGSTWTRNSNSWTQKGTPLDFTGVAGSNDDLAHHANNMYQGGATLITPRHFVTANHFRFENGSTINFYDRSGNLVSRKLVNSYTVPGTDINIGLLDSDVDSGITNYSIISTAVLESLASRPNNYYYLDLPIVVLNQKGQAIIRSLIKKDTPKSFNHLEYAYGLRSGFTGNAVVGDSGQPGFIIIDNKPVLLFTNYLTEQAPSLGDYANEINSAITVLGNDNGYKVNLFNNTRFNSGSLCTGPVLLPPSSFVVTTNTSCLSSASQAKVNVSWNKPLNFSLVPNTYQYRLSINGASPDFLTIDKTSYEDTNVKPNTTYTYSLKLYSGSYSSDEVKAQVNVPALCVTQPLVQPVTQPVAQTTPLIQPVVQPIVQPVVQPVLQPLAAKSTTTETKVETKILDSDDDGVLDTNDKCPNTNSFYKSEVNVMGCIKPRISKFNYSVNLNSTDIKSVNNFEISNSYGKILFNSRVNLTRSDRPMDIDSNIYIGRNTISLNRGNIPELNRGATLTLNYITYKNPVILRDDVMCSDCRIVYYSNNILKFNVSGFSTYSVEEGYVDQINTPVEVVQPAVQPVVQPIVQPVIQPVVQTIAQPVVQPVVKQSVAKPIEQTITQSIVEEERIITIPEEQIETIIDETPIKYEKPSYVQIAFDYVKYQITNVLDRIVSGLSNFLR